MRIKNHTLVELVTTESAVYATDHCKLIGDRIVATNGRSLAIVEVERHGEDVDGLVSAEAIKLARSAQKRHDKALDRKEHASTLIVRPDQDYTFADGSTLPKKPDEKLQEFPNYELAIPRESEAIFHVALSPRLLFELARALGCADVGVRLCVSRSKESGVLVKPLDGSKGLGVLMPITTAEENVA